LLASSRTAFSVVVMMGSFRLALAAAGFPGMTVEASASN
jgi:hypothetical protein